MESIVELMSTALQILIAWLRRGQHVRAWVAIDHRWCVSMNRAGGGAVQALAARECKASV